MVINLTAKSKYYHLIKMDQIELELKKRMDEAEIRYREAEALSELRSDELHEASLELERASEDYFDYKFKKRIKLIKVKILNIFQKNKF